MDLHFLVLDVLFQQWLAIRSYIFLLIVYIRNIDAVKEAIGSTQGS